MLTSLELTAVLARLVLLLAIAYGCVQLGAEVDLQLTSIAEVIAGHGHSPY